MLTRKQPLRHRRDLQSLAYLLAVPALAVWQWHFGFNAPLYALMIALWIGIGVINHNHAHVPMWRRRWLNRATDLWIGALQGHPAYVFHPAHNANHHRYRHGPHDVARTYRFRGGDTNSLLGYLLHPLQAATVLIPLLSIHVRRLNQKNPAAFRWAMTQHVVVLMLWLACAGIDARNTLVYVLIPQLIALHWLLGANYFQHAHADGLSRWNYARNFEGAVNWLYFNIGLHTAHHEAPRLHWSALPRLHAELRHKVDPRLIERGLLRYVLRVFLLGAVFSRWRSVSLMQTSTKQTNVQSSFSLSAQDANLL